MRPIHAAPTPRRRREDRDDTPVTRRSDQRARVLVVDPQPLLRWALTHITANSDDLVVVSEAESPAAGARVMPSVNPDVVTVECAGAEGEGWTLVGKLRESDPQLGIVVLTADGSDQMLFRALNLGASAFVSKSAPIPDVLAAIRHAATAPSSFIASGLADALRRRSETTEGLTLSSREHEILLLLHDGMSVPAVARQLHISVSTAKTYVARLYDKLGARNRAQALMTAVRLGMLDERLSAVV